MKEFFYTPFFILFNKRYKRLDAFIEFICLIVGVGLLGTWMQFGYFLFPYFEEPGVGEIISGLFSYYIALFPTIFMDSNEKSRTNWGIIMLIICLFGALSLGIKKEYVVGAFCLNILLTIFTIFCWAFVNNSRFLKNPKDSSQEEVDSMFL